VCADATKFSLRDPAGQVFISGDRVLRHVHAEGLNHLDIFLKSPVLAEFKKTGQMISGTEKNVSEIPEDLVAAFGPSNWLEHPKIPFVSYPFEWPASVLYDAGKLTLELAQKLNSEGILLKDAAADNLTLKNGKLIFLDALSFEKRPEKSFLWMAAAQFERAFIIPLLANRLCQIPVSLYLSQTRDGPSPKEVAGLFSGIKRFHPLVLKHVVMPSMLDGRSPPPEAYQIPRSQSEEKASFIFEQTLKRLDRAMTKLEPRSDNKSTWSEYADSHNYDDKSFEKKVSFIRKVSSDLRGKTVLDIGCNDGYFSKLFLEAGASVIALDSDPVVVDRLWRKVRNQNLDIIPLVQNITSPSPGSGWRNGEKQSFLDRICGLPHTAILLAVVHHMMVTDGIPLDEIIDLVAEIVSAEVIIEFIPIDDPMFRKICRGRENLYSWYDQKSFEISCLRRFEIIETCLLEPSGRKLYRLRIKS
jgi:hypothetical protein